MQSLKAIVLARRFLPALRFLPHHRSLSIHPNTAQDDELQNQVLVDSKASSRTAIPNRPSALNALTNTMAVRLKKLYGSWEENPDIGFVMMKGSGRAFCAGGDVVTLYQLLKEGKVEDCKDFCRNIYEFIYILDTYLKPHVALLDGITMGGGLEFLFMGHSALQLKTLFSLPQKLILAFILMLGHPFTCHTYLVILRLGIIEDRLGKLTTDDPSVIESSIEQYGDLVYPDKKSFSHRMEVIDKCFGRETVEEIIDALESEVARLNDEWCTSALKKLKEASPLILKVSLKSIREGRNQTLDQCLVHEYRMSLHGISKEVSSDFYEGVRARLVNKDLAPKECHPLNYLFY